MAQLPLSKAAKLVGLSRQTLYRYVSLGRLSVTMEPDPSRTHQPGAKEGFVRVVDTAELERVFGPLQGRREQSQDKRGDGTAQPSTTAAVLQVELAAAQAALAVAQAALAEAKEREARLLDLLASQTKLLTFKAKPKKAKATDQPKAAKKKKAASRR